jgi:hypothetical protein
MTTYYVATLARYVLVDADTESDARQRGCAALHDLYADDGRAGAAINVRTVRPATDDEIEQWRWHHRMVARELGERLVDPALQAETDWTPMSVPGRENADGTETPTAWFAFNRATRKSVRFANLDEATAFCFHPDNRR